MWFYCSGVYLQHCRTAPYGAVRQRGVKSRNITIYGTPALRVLLKQLPLLLNKFFKTPYWT